MDKITEQEAIKRSLNYNPDTGDLTWKYNKNSKARKGSIAGSVPDNRYRAIVINYKRYYAHRIAWLIFTGEWPKYQIDHIDGDKLNNAISNLRDVTHKDNHRNMTIISNNKSGIHGVYWISSRNRWVAKIGREYLGSVTDFFEACCLKKSAEFKHGYHENHGNKPLPQAGDSE